MLESVEESNDSKSLIKFEVEDKKEESNDIIDEKELFFMEFSEISDVKKGSK